MALLHSEQLRARDASSSNRCCSCTSDEKLSNERAIPAAPRYPLPRPPLNYSGRVDPGQKRQHFSNVVVNCKQYGGVRVQARHRYHAGQRLVQEVAEGQGISHTDAVDNYVVVNDARVRRE